MSKSAGGRKASELPNIQRADDKTNTKKAFVSRPSLAE
jgi:hypothetical protein